MAVTKKVLKHAIDTTKKGLILEVSQNSGFSQKEVKTILNAYQRTILTVLKKDGEVRLLDLGKLKVVKTSKRTAINPQTKKKIEVPSKEVPKITFGKKVKEYVNDPHAQWPDFEF